MRTSRFRFSPFFLAGFLTAGCATARVQDATPSGPQIYTDSIPGTLVRFEMVGVPGTSIAIGRTEVTWDMYDTFALRVSESRPAAGADAHARPSQPYGAPDYGWGHAGFPVISVTRAAALAFCDWLSAKTGTRYRLPTEDEWQHTAGLAAGTPLLHIDSIAWHRGNSEDRTHPVATMRPDALSLYDLFGNAAEWVTTTDDTRVTRGGSFRDRPGNTGTHARAVQDATWNERDPQLPKSQWWLSDGPFVGFRMVREAPTPR